MTLLKPRAVREICSCMLPFPLRRLELHLKSVKHLHFGRSLRYIVPTFMAIFNYLDLGIKGENIKYWVFQSNSDLSTDLYEGETELLAEKRKI